MRRRITGWEGWLAQVVPVISCLACRFHILRSGGKPPFPTCDPASQHSLRTDSLLHQNLTKLQPIAGRVAKSGDAHDAGHLVSFAFELNALFAEFLLHASEIVNSQHYGCTAFVIAFAQLIQSDRGAAIRVAELAPAFHLEGLLEAQHFTVEPLCDVHVIHLIPRNIDFHFLSSRLKFHCWWFSRMARLLPPNA